VPPERHTSDAARLARGELDEMDIVRTRQKEVRDE
jgi:hypothetical protein